jgi:hypothetical protein
MTRTSHIAVFAVKTKSAMITMTVMAAAEVVVLAAARSQVEARVLARVLAAARTATKPMTKENRQGLAALSPQRLVATTTTASDRGNKLKAAAPVTHVNLPNCDGSSAMGLETPCFTHVKNLNGPGVWRLGCALAFQPRSQSAARRRHRTGHRREHEE